MRKLKKAEQLQDRTKEFAISIIKLCRILPRTEESRLVRGQLLRCGTSVGSNYRAACRGRSDREFYAKLCIVVEEADETLFWVGIIRDAKVLPAVKVSPLYDEAKEIVSLWLHPEKPPSNV